MPHNHQKKIAVINDYSGFGRCSVAVELPIFSVMKIQCCPVPTSVFSNHTGFPSFFFEDFTDKMQAYIEEWKKLGLQFSGICSGFLGSQKQIEIVEEFFRYFKRSDNVVVVDPVMGDGGKPYKTYTAEMCQSMKALLKYANVVTPNLTEACILTDTPYKAEFSRKEIAQMGEKLREAGPEKVVITGVQNGRFVENHCFEKEKNYVVKVEKVDSVRSGTGDIFTAIIAADAVNGVELKTSVKKASLFIKKCILKGVEMDIPKTDGVPFEELLYTLH